MFKPATAVALAAGGVLVVSGLSAGAVALQTAFEVGESPAHSIDVDAVSGEKAEAEPTPTPTPTPVVPDAESVPPAAVPVVAVPVPVDDDVPAPAEEVGDAAVPATDDTIDGSGEDVADDSDAIGPNAGETSQPAPKPVAAVPQRDEQPSPVPTGDRVPARSPDKLADDDAKHRTDRHRDNDRLERADRDGRDGRDRDGRDHRGGRDGGDDRGDRGPTGREGSGG